MANSSEINNDLEMGDTIYPPPSPLSRFSSTLNTGRRVTGSYSFKNLSTSRSYDAGEDGSNSPTMIMSNAGKALAVSNSLSEEMSEIKNCLMRYGGVKACDLNQPRDELRKTVTEIQKEVHSQLEQTRRTNQNVTGIAKELKRLHREGINNATNSVTVVAVLFATVAFAAIFTVPGGDYDTGEAVVASTTSFKVFFIFNAIALFTSLSVVVVQITLVRGETKSERKVIEVINKLMWLASVCTTVSFISSSYIVVGRHYKWAAIFVTVLGAGVMAGVLGTMTYYVVKYKRIRKVRKKEKSSMKQSHTHHGTDVLSDDSAVNTIYAI